MQELKVEGLASFVDISFWHTLANEKLKTIKLDTKTIPLTAHIYPGIQNIPSRLHLNSNSFNALSYPEQFRMNGTLHLTNTIDEFKKLDKNKILMDHGSRILNDIECEDWMSSFILIVYVDLKKFKFYYWFAFPVLTLPNVSMELRCLRNETYFEEFKESISKFFIVERKLLSFLWNSVTKECYELNELSQLTDNDHFCVIDSSGSADFPGMAVRNVIAYAKLRFNASKISIICVRNEIFNLNPTYESSSLLLTFFMPEEIDKNNIKTIGWEPNASGNPGARIIDLSTLMDPIKLSESAVQLNLQLMKWRIKPTLNLTNIQSQSCLLLGAGTLGTYIARSLMAWGIQKITFVDNSKVAYSNPVRQPLYTHKDAVNASFKAQVAAEKLKEIYPSINSEGHSFLIPMPGHGIDDNTEKSTKKLEELIKSHDIIFLLMDSRESRWLPTLLSAINNKCVITVALGFDTFVVMRHGISDNGLGCYFCNDVVAPIDSSKDRTLDQQCTVTRPGLAAVASGIAVELVASLLSHPLGVSAPADAKLDPMTRLPTDGLGIVPHQIRGYLSHFSNHIVTGQNYVQCTACSKIVCDAYHARGMTFLNEVFTQPELLEKITGLDKLREDVANEEFEWDESD